MKVGKKDVGVHGTVAVLAGQFFAQDAEAGAAIKDIKVAVDAHFYARGISAVAQILQLRRWRRTAHPPELDLHGGLQLLRALLTFQDFSLAHLAFLVAFAPATAGFARFGRTSAVAQVVSYYKQGNRREPMISTAGSLVWQRWRGTGSRDRGAGIGDQGPGIGNMIYEFTNLRIDEMKFGNP